ncbi:MAG: sigma-70 family RNA polymerase sigma factor [Ardenticatenales bacterium]|jgi:RNA polymerase sigma-70 factor (ECF subfamily)|nr:sigma-70 family RNA polymerase sigma factor [Ardenticatenales bacterium]
MMAITLPNEAMTVAETGRLSPTEAETVYADLVRTQHRAIYNYVYRIVWDAAVAEDVTQDAYLRAYRALRRLPRDANFRAWLYRIATNAATDELRRRKRRPAELLGLAPSLRADGENEDERLRRLAIEGAMAAIASHHRVILNLFEFAELSAPEVAEALGIKPEAARKRRQRAREALAQALKGFDL